MRMRTLMVTALATAIVGCHHDDDDNQTTEYRYSVKLVNLTANQPMSPLAILAHSAQFSLFEVGQSSSVELEYLAEGGSNAQLLELMQTDESVEYSVSGNGLILPGESDNVEFTLNDGKLYLSVATMLVNTNDAFVANYAIDLSELQVGDSYRANASIWDSGTEANDEQAATIPGPAGGGEGFNAIRDDNDRVSFHNGVVTQDDGLTGSALNATHRFLNPGAALEVTRLE